MGSDSSLEQLAEDAASGDATALLQVQARLLEQALTGLVALCEKDGFVMRERDPEDGRAFRISLTPRGRRLSRRRRRP
jgi:DNA-binding MarR family transcriptional regulator